MALGDPTTSFLDDWYAAMMQPAPMPMGVPAPAPLSIAADPEQAAPQAAAVQAPPPVPEQPAPMMPGFESIVDPSTWGGGTDALPTPDVPLAPVGSGLDQYGFEKTDPVVPEPEMPDSIVNPLSWGAENEAAPVGSVRLNAAPGEQGLSLEERQQLKLSNPLAYEKLKIDEAEDQAAQARAGMAQIARRDEQTAELSLRNFRESQQRSQEMMKQVEADVAALANEKPKKYEAGAMDLIAGVLGMLGASATGGKNVGLELVNQRIERHIQEQRDEYNRKAGNVDRRMNLIAKLRDAGYDDYQAGEVIRLSSLERAKQTLMSDIQNYDPQGTTARNKMAQYEAFNAAQAKAAEAMRQRDLDEKIKQGEYFIKARAADDAHNKAARVGVGGAPALDKQKFTADELSRMFPGQAVPTDGIARTPREYDQWLGTRGKGEELASKQRTNEQFDEAQVRELGVGMSDGDAFVNKDGKPFKARNAQVAEKLTKQANAAREVADIIDEVIAIRERSGGESKIWNSDDRQRLDVLQDRLVILEKGGTEGMSSEEDMKKLSNAIGASDVSSFRSRSAGLEKGRERTVGFLNQTLRSNQYTGKPVTVPNRFNLPKPKPKLTDELLDRAMKTEYTPTTGLATAAANATPAAQQINSSYETDVKGLAAQAEFAPDEQDKRAARAALENLAQKHPTEAGRALATEAVKQLPGAAPVRER